MRSCAFLILAVAPISMVRVICRVLCTLTIRCLMSRRLGICVPLALGPEAGLELIDSLRERIGRLVGELLLGGDGTPDLRVGRLEELRQLVAEPEHVLDLEVVEVALG